MKVTLIRPNMNAARSFDAMQPLALAVLAGQTPPDVELECFDERTEELPEHLDTDLIAISVQTFTARRAYEIADGYRARGHKVIMGGYHPAFAPEEVLAHADAAVLGSAEEAWPRALRDARAGKLARVYREDQALPLADIVYDRRIFAGKKYVPALPVEFNRGCRFECDFCSVTAFNGGASRSRPVRDVIEEMERLPGRLFVIVDDNIYADPAEAIKFFQALAALKVRWGCQISLNIAKDEKALKLMERAGCIVALIGLETFSPANLKLMRKSLNARQDYATSIRKIKDCGIMILGSYIFGYDDDDLDVFDRSVDFALEHKFFLTNFNTLTPMPGTGLHARLKNAGRLFCEDWWLEEKYRYGEVMFRPAKMTPEQLKEGCIRARLKFNRYASIAKRALDPGTNCRDLARLGVFLGGNIVARREVLRKTELLR